MLIIGCDFHPGFQQVAIFDNQTGEYEERRLSHRAEAEQFYCGLAGQSVRVGMEACGHYPWFERLLSELGIELWLGDAAKIRASVVRQQKTDRRDAEHLQKLLREGALRSDALPPRAPAPAPAARAKDGAGPASGRAALVELRRELAELRDLLKKRGR